MGFVYFGTPCITKFTTHNRQKSFSTLRHYKAIPVAKLNFARHKTIQSKDPSPMLCAQTNA